MAKPVGGLIAFEQEDLKEHCMVGLAWAQRLLQGNGGDTVEDGLAAERAAGQLAISSRCIGSLELPGDTEENAAKTKCGDVRHPRPQALRPASRTR